MTETNKAKERRIKELFFEKYAPPTASGIDIGCGDDLLGPSYRGYDTCLGSGDATFMAGIPDNQYEVVYSSHLLEHLRDPHTSLRNWYRITKVGGYLIIVVPHRDLYEKKPRLPSRFNPQHVSFWLPDRDEWPVTVRWGAVLILTGPGVIEVASRGDERAG